ncbi:archease [Patescibacteria group bacterium]|nr:archease [Patescibacteria group bacterium]MBU1015812.1 archease [Patescibacteria group bacterium]MBU1685231.1 archease [Patescibacteria group bacterium]MBU1938240.1 archease [Patescibacteria group bacterium]
MKKFEFRSDIALSDCAFYAYGKNLEDLIVNACEAVTEAMVSREKIEAKEEKSFEIRTDSLEGLLYLVLDEIIYLKDADQLVFCNFEIKELEEKPKSYFLSMKLAGEKIDHDKHESHSDVKAVTYHQFEVKKTPTGYRASVILDI